MTNPADIILSDALTMAARDAGLTEEEEAPFLLWVGNEVAEGRLEAFWPTILESHKDLVRRFKETHGS